MCASRFVYVCIYTFPTFHSISLPESYMSLVCACVYVHMCVCMYAHVYTQCMYVQTHDMHTYMESM